MENQEHARQRLQIVLPIVLLVIFVLLYHHKSLSDGKRPTSSWPCRSR